MEEYNRTIDQMSREEILSKLLASFEDQYKINKSIIEEQKQLQQQFTSELQKLRELIIESQADSTGDDTEEDEDEDLTVFNDSAGEAYSQDDVVVESNPVPADSKSTSELGKCAIMEKQLKLVNQKSDVYEVRNDAHELFDESHKNEKLQVMAIESGKAQTCSADFIVNVLADENFYLDDKGEGAVDALGGFLIDSGCVSDAIEVPGATIPSEPPDTLHIIAAITDNILNLPTYPNSLQFNPAYLVVTQYFVDVDDTAPQYNYNMTWYIQYNYCTTMSYVMYQYHRDTLFEIITFDPCHDWGGVVVWNYMFGEYVTNNEVLEAFEFYAQMREFGANVEMRRCGFVHVEITFTAVSYVCGHYRLVEEEHRWFRAMKHETRYFCDEGDYASYYGRFFLNWYSQVLLDYGNRVLALANLAVEGTPIVAKLSGIHWWYKTASHAAELTAGFYNSCNRDGYTPIALMLKKYGATLNFTCVELRTLDQKEDFPEAFGDPDGLVWQVLNDAWDVDIPVAREDALPCHDREGYNKILEIAKPLNDPHGRHFSAFTYLCISPMLIEKHNLTEFEVPHFRCIEKALSSVLIFDPGGGTIYLITPNYASFGYLFYLLLWIKGRQLVGKTVRRLWIPLKIHAMAVFALIYCLEVYRRKVDTANRCRAQLRQKMADAESELAVICSEMGERPIHIMQSDQIPGSLKAELKTLLPQLEEMPKRKVNRRNQFFEVVDKIQMISSAMSRSDKPTEANTIIEDADLSLRKFEELFRKVGNQSSEFHPDVRRVRSAGSYLYEEFMSTGGTDVKVYTVGPEYEHAEARKSPVVDGVVLRNHDSKEVRYPVFLVPNATQMARGVYIALSQSVCGFDLLRCVITIIIHVDRTPKQKVQLKVTEEKLLKLLLKYNGERPRAETKLKSVVQLQDLLDATRILVPRSGPGHESDSEAEDIEHAENLYRVKAVLEQGRAVLNFLREAIYQLIARLSADEKLKYLPMSSFNYLLIFASNGLWKHLLKSLLINSQILVDNLLSNLGTSLRLWGGLCYGIFP